MTFDSLPNLSSDSSMKLLTHAPYQASTKTTSIVSLMTIIINTFIFYFIFLL